MPDRAAHPDRLMRALDANTAALRELAVAMGLLARSLLDDEGEPECEPAPACFLDGTPIGD